MTHQSEAVVQLRIHDRAIATLEELPTPNLLKPEVWFFVLPFGRTIHDVELSRTWLEKLHRFSESLHTDSIVCILTSAEDAAETWTGLSDVLQYQLLVSVKLSSLIGDEMQLPFHHAELLIMSKYRSSLRHTKTRIAYTFCPACNKTTKDYGGKKHLYDQYGTLASDVWRDIEYTPGGNPEDIVIRLADLFGQSPYADLEKVDLTGVESLAPKPEKAMSGGHQSPGQVSKKLDSKLVLGDSLVELRKIPDNSIDFCFADPPYNLAKRYDSWDDSINAEEYLSWCDEWLDELARVLKPGRTVAVLNIPILAIRHFEHMKESLSFQSWITWEGLSLPVRNIMPSNYSIVCFSKGTPRPLPGLIGRDESPMAKESMTTACENYCVRASCINARSRAGDSDRAPISDLWWDIHRLKHNSRRVDHPCQLPPTLMRRLIALYTEEGEVVLDPFDGAGTTTLCAAEMSRGFIGMELSPKYHEIAAERHRGIAKGIDPFGKVEGVPNSKNSRVGRVGDIKYEVPKKTLQLDVKRIAALLGRTPNRDEVEAHSEYPIRLYDEYFSSWADATAAARTTGMSENRQGSAA
jgi:DNA modification methylase